MSATDLDIITAYIAKRDWIDAQNKMHDERLKPVKDQMTLLENEMLRRLNERGADNSATDAGTAYRERSMSVKTTDKTALHQFCIQNYTTWGKDLLTAAVSKETLRTYMEQTKSEQHPGGLVPPGLALDWQVHVRFRR